MIRRGERTRTYQVMIAHEQQSIQVTSLYEVRNAALRRHEHKNVTV